MRNKLLSILALRATGMAWASIFCAGGIAFGQSGVATLADTGRTIINPCQPAVERVPPNSNLKLTLSFDAEPLGEDARVFLYLRDASGQVVARDSHLPPWPIKTSSWSGRVSYERSVRVSHTIQDGEYDVLAGLESTSRNERVAIAPGPGASPTPNNAVKIGRVLIDSAAANPPSDLDGKQPTLNLEGFRLTFEEQFEQPLDVSADGGARWTSRLPYGGRFGDAAFAPPNEDFPFELSDGRLLIKASKRDGRWESGLLSSVDSSGEGFTQTYGYFEMRAQLPKGPGTWPAFWLLTTDRLQEDWRRSFEIDIVEQYGHAPRRLHTVVHWWDEEKHRKGAGNVFWLDDLTADFHNYGCKVDEDFIIFYFDGIELWRTETPRDAKKPKFILLNLALGPGWPLDKTPDPSVMKIDYVRVYDRTSSPEQRRVNLSSKSQSEPR